MSPWGTANNPKTVNEVAVAGDIEEARGGAAKTWIAAPGAAAKNTTHFFVIV